MNILDAAKPQQLHYFISWEQWTRRMISEQRTKDKEAQRLALLSVAAPRSYVVKEGRG